MRGVKLQRCQGKMAGRQEAYRRKERANPGGTSSQGSFDKRLDGIDYDLWSLCIDHKGNVINNPNDIANNWTLEQVMTAIDIKDVRADNYLKERKRLEESQKNAMRKPRAPRRTR